MDDNLFFKYFTKLYKRLAGLDKEKYLNPKFSFAFKDLSAHLGIYENPFETQGDDIYINKNGNHMNSKIIKV
jgi:hypothetical protein